MLKEKIERFAKGDFEYELPSISLSVDELQITVEAGKYAEGSFVVSNSTGRPMKGIVYSSNRQMKLENQLFNGIENIIRYKFDATYLAKGETINGQLCIVSDCGEKSLPFSVQTEVPYCMTSLGKIKDLFQFTNLARMDWSEAKKVFRSEDFERIFLNNEDRYRFIYRDLLKSVSTSQALEEFLVAIHKKSVIRLEIDKTRLEYHALQEPITDKLVLTKNNWGYAEIRVSADEPFIQLEQKFLWADRFIGNTHQVFFTIDPKNLKHGNNYGHIYIKTAQQTITVDVICKSKREEHKASETRVLQKAQCGLVDNYLDFRLNRIDLTQYLEEAEELIKRLPGPESSYIRELMKTHLSIVAGKNKISEELLNDLAAEEAAIKKRSILEYCIYLYLVAMYRKDDESIHNAAENIRHYYLRGDNDWRLLWLLLYTDKHYERNKAAKLEDIKEQYDAGCRSPILYYEAVCIYNEEPFLLRELSPFEIQVINYGIRNWFLSKDVAGQYIYLAGKMKYYHPIVFHNLERLYDEYGTEEILSAICSMLIKGMKRSEEYFEWFRLGVEAQLRITELYEYYMYTISDTVEGPLAQPVLLYFIYNSSLSDRKKAFLYANIVRNKNKNESIYRTYYRRIEVFTAKMLENHQISKDLAILYKEFLPRLLQNSELASHLPYVMYRNELVCRNPNITSIAVIHKEFGSEEIVQLVDGKAQVDIYTSNVELFLMDSFGNRYVETVDFTVTPYLNPEEYESICMEHSNHPMLLLHLFDKYQSLRILNDQSIEIRKKVLLIEGLGSEYRTQCCQTLVDYYYENYNDEQLERYLDIIDLKMVQPEERIRLIEIMISRGFFDKALEAVKLYGPEKILVTRLIILCSGWMAVNTADKKQEELISLCYYVFIQKKYDESILHYLLKYYNGSGADMLRIWHAARAFDLDTHALEERLLSLVLFSESSLAESYPVFINYYNSATNHTLVRAYLSYCAYLYLVWDYDIDSELFPIMRRELFYEDNDICLAAWLKYNSTNNKLTENERTFIEYNIDRLVRKGIILPFFLEYQGKLILPDRLLGRCFITWISDPRKQVFIHYSISESKEQDYVTERMPNVFLGIHLKELVLFFHEEVRYYITEESEKGNLSSENFILKHECGIPEDDDSRYNLINMMVIASEMQDDDTLLNMMESYMIKEYVANSVFHCI